MPTYFHVSREKLPLGAELGAKGGPHIADEIEAYLEKARPNGKLARADAIYMLDHVDFSKSGVPYEEGYVHLVEPHEPVQKHDAQWIGRMQRRRWWKRHAKLTEPPKDLTDEQLAAGYWSGDASGDKGEWEYLAGSARVVGHHSDEPVQTGRRLPSIPGA